MQQQPPHRFEPNFAADFQLPPTLPIDNGPERGFGRGHTVGAVTGFCLFISCFVNLYLARGNDVHLVRGVGYLLVVVGSSFTFAIGYHIVRGINIPWSAARFGKLVAEGEFDRRARPVAFWLAQGTALLLFWAMIASGIWLIVRDAWVATKLG